MTVQPAERVDTDLSVIEALDFDPEVPCLCCEFQGRTPAAAVWYLLRSCGCHPDPYCSPCRDFARAYAAVGPIHCLTCGTDPITIRFRPIKAT